LSLIVERSDGYKKLADCKTLGDHLRRRRRMLGLWQKEVGQILGVSKENVFNWETNHTKPMVHAYPDIMDFLGYCPVQYTKNLGDRIRLYRTHQGYSILELANILGVDECTLGSWERTLKSRPRYSSSRAVIQRILTPAA